MAVLVVVIVLMHFGGRPSAKQSAKNSQKNKAKLVRDAARKLKQDPHNVAALKEMSNFYYEEHNWEKAYPLYNSLLDLTEIHPELDKFLISVRQGKTALKLNKLEDSFRGLVKAYQLNPNDYDVCYNLGIACYQNNDFAKAIPCLRKALTLRPESTDAYGPIGSALYKTGKFKESIKFLRKALDEHPENKENLFNLADAMYESGYGEKAMKVFLHLRADPKFGPQSCLLAGKIHMSTKSYEKAIQDFEIGLRHQDTPEETLVNLRYMLASCYFAINAMGKGLEQLKKIQIVAPAYKDVPALIAKYSELNQNSNLQIYLSASTSDYVALCRKIVVAFYPNSFVKIADVSVTPENCEIQCSVDTSKWEDNELFRFYRTTGSTGELYVRDFHSKVKDMKVDKGICITAGHFSEEAHKYIEGRPLDLIEKDKLIKILKKVDSIA
ncbi:MAG: tetratricopeptide repeat protein [Treponema sp.]|nr:tetratricopeptide repeat protein [Treponema sp.]